MAETPSGQTSASLEISARRLIQEEDPDNSNYTSSEILDYNNEGVRRLSTFLGWQYAVFTATSVEDQPTYTIPDHMITLMDFYFDGEPLPVVDRTDMPSIDASWLTATSNRPRFAYRADRNKFGLYPKPSSTYAGLEMRSQAIKLPDTLTDDEDIADIHLSFHDCIPYYGAFKCELKAGNNQRAADFLKIWKDYRDEIKGVLEKTADQMTAFHFGGRANDEPRTL